MWMSKFATPMAQDFSEESHVGPGLGELGVVVVAGAGGEGEGGGVAGRVGVV